MNNLFIVFEGLSGSGKTTIGKIVAEKIGAEFYETPGPLFASIRKKIDGEADNLTRFLFYLASVFHASKEIKEIIMRKSVVCDRYLLTTLCWHKVIGVDFQTQESFFNNLLKPDYTFLIVCSQNTRLKRLYSRGLSYNDEKERNDVIEKRFLEEYKKYNPIEIDNSGQNPQKAAEKVVKLLKE